MADNIRTTEEVVDELLRPLREQLLTMARYGDLMREQFYTQEARAERAEEALDMSSLDCAFCYYAGDKVERAVTVIGGMATCYEHNSWTHSEQLTQFINAQRRKEI